MIRTYDIEISGYLAPDTITVSGRAEEIKRFIEDVRHSQDAIYLRVDRATIDVI